MFPAIARLPRADSATLQQWLGRAATATSIVLALILGDRLAALLWALVPPPDQAEFALPDAKVIGGQPPERDEVAYQRIAGWHLFGEVPQAPAPKAAQPQPAPESVPATQLKLSLRGVFHYPDEPRQRAIIAGQDGKEDVYAVGDSLPGGATLQEIGPYRVVLSRQGRLEALSFPEDAQGGSGGRGSIQVTPTAETVTRIDASGLVGRYRESMKNDPTALSDIAQVQPYIELGTFRGFRLRPGRQSNLLRQLGLRPGDVVTSVNGVPLDSMAQAMESLRNFADSDQMDITVQRNGREISYNFQLN
jgi:general secretion pathway protein C